MPDEQQVLTWALQLLTAAWAIEAILALQPPIPAATIARLQSDAIDLRAASARLAVLEIRTPVP